MSGTSGPIGNLPPDFGGAAGSPILTLAADPTLTATAGLLAQLGTFGGNLYIHLTAASDTHWFLFRASSGGLPVLALSADPTSTPTAGAQGQFGIFGTDLYLHYDAGTSLSWVRISDVDTLVVELLPVAGNLAALGAEQGNLEAAMNDVLLSALATGAFHIGPPQNFLDGDGLALPDGSGGVCLISFQVTDGYVAPVGTTVTIDLRPFLPGGSIGDVMPLVQAALEANTTLQELGAGGGDENVGYSAAGSAGNQPIVVTQPGRPDWPTGGFALGAQGLSQGRDYGLAGLLPVLLQLNALAFHEQAILDNLPQTIHEANHDEAASFDVVITGIRQDRAYVFELAMAVGAASVFLYPDNDPSQCFELSEFFDSSALPNAGMSMESQVGLGLRMGVADADVDANAHAKLFRRLAASTVFSSIPNAHFEVTQSSVAAPTSTRVFCRATGSTATDYSGFTIHFTDGCHCYLKVTQVLE